MIRVDSLSLIEERKILTDVSEMSSVIIDHFGLIKLTATELVRITENLQIKSGELRLILKRSEEQLGRDTIFISYCNLIRTFLQP